MVFDGERVFDTGTLGFIERKAPRRCSVADRRQYFVYTGTEVMVSRGAQAFLIPSPGAVNELAARSVTSPRLRQGCPGKRKQLQAYRSAQPRISYQSSGLQEPLSARQGGEGPLAHRRCATRQAHARVRREGREGEVGDAANRFLDPPHPALSPRPAGGEDK